MSIVKKASTKRQVLVKKAYAKALVKYAFSDPVFKKYLLQELKSVKFGEGEEGREGHAALGAGVGGLAGMTSAIRSNLRDFQANVTRKPRLTTADAMKLGLMELLPDNYRQNIRSISQAAQPYLINSWTKPFVTRVANPHYLWAADQYNKLNEAYSKTLGRTPHEVRDTAASLAKKFEDVELQLGMPRSPYNLPRLPSRTLYRSTGLGRLLGRTALGSILGGVVGDAIT